MTSEYITAQPHLAFKFATHANPCVYCITNNYTWSDFSLYCTMQVRNGGMKGVFFNLKKSKLLLHTCMVLISMAGTLNLKSKVELLLVFLNFIMRSIKTDVGNRCKYVM